MAELQPQVHVQLVQPFAQVDDAGTSGHGFKLAPMLGKYVADLMLDSIGDPGLGEFHPDRFTTGSLVSGGYGRAQSSASTVGQVCRPRQQQPRSNRCAHDVGVGGGVRFPEWLDA